MHIPSPSPLSFTLPYSEFRSTLPVWKVCRKSNPQRSVHPELHEVKPPAATAVRASGRKQRQRSVTGTGAATGAAISCVTPGPAHLRVVQIWE